MIISLIVYALTLALVVMSAQIYSFQKHQAAIIKFAFLYIFATSPVLIAGLFSPVGVNENYFSAFIDKVISSVKHDEIFIYVSSFMAPFFYIIIERFIAAKNDLGFKRGRSTEKFASYFRLPRVFWFVTVIACIVMLFAVLKFGSAKMSDDQAKRSLLDAIAADYIWYFYFFSLGCFYLSIVDTVNDGDSSFVEDNMLEEDDMIDRFERRVGGK